MNQEAFAQIPLPPNEAERLATLHRYHILDTPPETAFDRITALAARLFEMPIALVSLIDASRAWIKSSFGWDIQEVPREVAICSLAILENDILVIPDTQKSDRLRGNPVIQGESGIRFYAGAPLITSDGFKLGTLCLLDTKPHHELTVGQKATLADLAAMVVDELELRLASEKVSQIDAALLQVTQGVSTVTGEAFFLSLVQHFTQVLEVDYAYIGLLVGEELETIQTIAVCAQGQIADNFTYLLRDTPCREVIQQGKICCYPSGVQTQFPDAPLLAPLGIDGYIATPFSDSTGTPLGLLGIMSCKPLENIQLAQALLTLFAMRIATELERQQTEAALRQREADLSLVTNTVPVLISFIDAQQCYRFNNKAYEEWFGHPAAAIYGKHMQEVLGAGAYAAILPYVEQVLAGQQVTFESNVPYKDGGSRYISATYVPRFDGQGNVEGFVALVSDISASKKAEAALSVSEAKFRSFVESNVVGILFGDIYGNIFQANDELLKIVGYTKEDVEAGKLCWIDITPPEYLHLDDKHIAEARATGACTPYEKEYIRKDGSRVPVLIGYSLLGEAREESVVFILDLTERKRVEAERTQLLTLAQQQTLQLQKLAEASLTINSVSSLNARLRLITDLAREIIGTHQSVTSMTDQEEWAKAIHTVSLSDKYAQWHDYNQQPSGSGIYTRVCQMRSPMRLTQAELEAHPAWRGFGKEAGKHPPMRGWLAAPLTSRDGKNLGLIQLSDKYEGEFTPEDEAILVQLAQMAASAIDNARLYEESQTANRIKDEFLAVLSHELRSPLSPILGWTKLLQSQKLDAAQATQALNVIERNAKLQAELINDLLDVSRILQGKLSLNTLPVDLGSTIQAAIETVRLAAEAKSIQIQATFKPNLGQVAGDPNRLQQVIWNLLSNAVKFTDVGGRVDIQLTQLDAHAQITISDTGKGIDPDFLPYVFDYFRQADATTTRQFGGLGLGLAIVRHLVELHGGTVQAQSQGIGQGATFIVKLPLILNPTQTQPETEQSEEFLDLSGINILVVDDDADIREFIAFLLEQYGASVTTAASANEALVAFTQSQPDVLLCDIGMPEVDGYMLIRQVRNLAPEQGGKIRAIALTAYAGEIDYQQAIAAGFQRHIAKPVEPEHLVEEIYNLYQGAVRNS